MARSQKSGKWPDYEDKLDLAGNCAESTSPKLTRLIEGHQWRDEWQKC